MFLLDTNACIAVLKRSSQPLLDRLRKASPGETTWVHLRWYPVSSEGYRLGTGAYILMGQAWTRSGYRVREDGSWARSPGGSAIMGPFRFGFLRE